MIQFLWSNIYISHLQVNEKFSSNVPLEKENLIPVEIGILIDNAYFHKIFFLLIGKRLSFFHKKI